MIFNIFTLAQRTTYRLKRIVSIFILCKEFGSSILKANPPFGLAYRDSGWMLVLPLKIGRSSMLLENRESHLLLRFRREKKWNSRKTFFLIRNI